MPPTNAKVRPPEVRILRSQDAATEILLGELRQRTERPDRPLISFATGGTFTAMLQALHAEVQAQRLALDRLAATHLDEYEGYAPEQRGSMVHELCAGCPSLLAMLQQGTFLPVPNRADASVLRAHEQQLRRLGGVDLQLLGIGRNGHLAFHEPGVPWDRGYHIAELSATTREDARARFHPAPVPLRAITAGVATILAGRRLVLCAFGKSKAPAVRAMLEGEVSVACPASAIRGHGNALVLLDRDAASQLVQTAAGSS